MEKKKPAKPKSIMYTGGTIRPLKCGNAYETVEAIGFHKGKVVAAGSESDVSARMSKTGKYHEQQLHKGQTLLPGLIDPHLHISTSGGLSAAWNDFGPFEGQKLQDSYNSDYLRDQIMAVKDTLKCPADSSDPAWILGYGVDPSLMPLSAPMKLVSLNCDTVNEMESELPVFMMAASMHTVYINQTAAYTIFEKIGPVKPPDHEELTTKEEYYEYVNSQGGLQELAMIIPAFKAIPLPSNSEVVEGITSLFEMAVERGITLLYDAGMDDKTAVYLKPLADLCNIRIGFAKICNSVDDVNALGSYVPPTDEFSNVYQGSIKIVSDGSNQGLSGYQWEDYRCKAVEPKGTFNFKVKDFEDMVKIAIDKNWPLMIHANGNRAIDNVITAYRKALNGKSGLIKRHRIEHCSLPTEQAIGDMFELGLSPSFLIGHVGYWGHVFKKTIFEDKALLLDPCQSALRKDMRITFHSDYMVTPLGPLRMMEQAITRVMEQDPNKEVLNKEERLTPAQALKAITYDAAWQCHADTWVGSLEVGKLADYVILAEDPITIKDPSNIRNISVLETWIGGIQAHPKKHL